VKVQEGNITFGKDRTYHWYTKCGIIGTDPYSSESEAREALTKFCEKCDEDKKKGCWKLAAVEAAITKLEESEFNEMPRKAYRYIEMN
jgi:hypothetical protein